MYYIELFRKEIDGFIVIGDYTYSWMHPAKAFDPKHYTIDAMLAKIDTGEVEYFDFRVRVFLNTIMLSSGRIQNCLERNVEEMLTRDREEIEEFIDTIVLDAHQVIEKMQTLTKRKK